MGVNSNINKRIKILVSILILLLPLLIFQITLNKLNEKIFCRFNNNRFRIIQLCFDRISSLLDQIWLAFSFFLLFLLFHFFFLQKVGNLWCSIGVILWWGYSCCYIFCFNYQTVCFPFLSFPFFIYLFISFFSFGWVDLIEK